MSGPRRPRSAVLTLAVVGVSAVAAYGSGAAARETAGSLRASASSVRASTASTPTVKLARTSKGKILVNSRSFTLYMFTADSRNRDHCIKVRGCKSVWPPLTVSGRPTAGVGVKRSLLGTIRLPNGHKQVTYNGHPLYRYTGDGAPRSTYYIGFSSFGGRWYGVNAGGHAVH